MTTGWPRWHSWGAGADRGPLAALFRLMGKRQVRTYRRFGGQRLSSRMGSRWSFSPRVERRRG